MDRQFDKALTRLWSQAQRAHSVAATVARRRARTVHVPQPPSSNRARWKASTRSRGVAARGDRGGHSLVAASVTLVACGR